MPIVVIPPASTLGGRSVLAIIQDAAPLIGIAKPDAVYGATTETEQELASLANEVGERIARAHDWQRLKLQATIIGNGTEEEFLLPTDFMRMPKDSRLLDTATGDVLKGPISPQDYLERRNRLGGWHRWTLQGGFVKIDPLLDADQQVAFTYQSLSYAVESGNTLKTLFTADSDEFLLGDRLLRLGLQMEWRALKGLEYDREAMLYETALAQAIAQDKGARAVTQMTVGRDIGDVAWPGVLGP